MILHTQSDNWHRVRTVNSTDNGFPSRIPTGTKPSGIGDNAAQATASAVMEFGGFGSHAPNRIILCPYGAGSNNNTLSLRVIAWNKVDEGNPNTVIWIPTPLVELLCTLSSTPVGVAGKVLVAADLFADTIALTGTTANDDVDLSLCSPANDTIAHATIDCKGAQLLEITFTTGASATSCNALWRAY